jgi:hypothetical protein
MKDDFYHIRVEVEANNNEIVIGTDIGRSDLIQRIVRHWETQEMTASILEKHSYKNIRLERQEILKILSFNVGW